MLHPQTGSESEERLCTLHPPTGSESEDGVTHFTHRPEVGQKMALHSSHRQEVGQKMALHSSHRQEVGQKMALHAPSQTGSGSENGFACFTHRQEVRLSTLRFLCSFNFILLNLL